LFKSDVEVYRKYFSTSCVLINHYGSTETGAVCCYFIDKGTEIEGPCVPVGYPLEDIEVLVVDDFDNMVQVNGSGKIVVKSSFLPCAYSLDLEPTSEKTISGARDGATQIHHTGDLGRILNNGCLEYLGRIDSQVKVRGFRVDVAEVESVLADHPEVTAAAVTSRSNSAAEMQLIGYIVPGRSCSPTASSLRKFLLERLPEYMVPAIFKTVDALPLTASGKIDRHALPQPGKERPELAEPFTAPSTPTERALTKIWGKVLGFDQVGTHDSFFDLGGHSLTATRVISQVIKQFQLEIPLQSLFQSPTIAEMATVIVEHQAKKIAEPELGRILAEVESFSEEKARQVLADATGTNTMRAPDE